MHEKEGGSMPTPIEDQMDTGDGTATATQDAKHVPSMLMRKSLIEQQTMQRTERPVIRILPWLSVIKIGGHSIIDRGAEAVVPVVEELARALEQHRLLIATGAGIRSRHIFSVGLDLGLPTGVLATLSAADAEQNGHIIATLLAQHGVVFLPHMMVAHQLAMFLTTCNGVVMNGVPPYDLWEFPPEEGKIPEHRTDSGAFLLAESYGAQRIVFVEDVDGIYTADPKEQSDAEFIPEITAAELEALDLPTLPIDRMVLKLMQTSKLDKQVQIINGLVPDNITRALNGEHVGTIIRR
jgi:molybdenum storage protein